MEKETISELSAAIAKKHGLNEADQVKIMRCFVALSIFSEDHPEAVEVRELLRGDHTLLRAVADLCDEMDKQG